MNPPDLLSGIEFQEFAVSALRCVPVMPAGNFVRRIEATGEQAAIPMGQLGRKGSVAEPFNERGVVPV
eukprot:8375812-Prorocentrum_lima.AAC.1